MPKVRWDRRQLLILAASGLWACVRPPATRQDLATALGLSGAETQWLDGLDEAECSELLAALRTDGTAATPRAAELMLEVIGRRSRLFAYVGYPPADDAPDLCDGLLKE